jgi:hypothetical protein
MGRSRASLARHLEEKRKEDKRKQRKKFFKREER